MAARRRRGNGNPIFKSFVKYIILPLILVDAYAYWKVHQTSQSWLSGFLSLSEPLSQIAIILTINIAVIIILLLYIARTQQLEWIACNNSVFRQMYKEYTQIVTILGANKERGQIRVFWQKENEQRKCYTCQVKYLKNIMGLSGSCLHICS